MGARLRSASVLLAAAALGFAAGRFPFGDTPVAPSVPAVRTAAPAGAGSTVPPPAPEWSAPQVPGTLAGILGLRGDFAQTTALYVLASGKDQAGIERLLDEAASIRQRSERRAAASILYERFAEIDPEAAIRHIMSRDAEFDPAWLYGVFHSWSRTDLKAAMAYANTLDERSRMMSGSAILRARDDLPPAERDAIAANLKLSAVVQDPSAIDLRTPEAAERSWRAALAIGDRDARTMKLHALVQAWASQDPRTAIRAIESLADRRLRDELLQQGVHAWSEREPRHAVEWALARPSSQLRTRLLAATLGVLATRKPSVAMEMTEALPPPERRQVLPQVLLQWAGSDAPAAAARAVGLEEAQLRGESLMYVAMVYATQDGDEAFRWAASLPEADSESVMAMVIGQIAGSDPVRASALVNRIPSGPRRVNAIAAIAEHWTQWDPQAAYAWVARLPASDLGPSVYTSLFQQWAIHDIDAAVGHASQLFDAGHRNAALIGILGSPYLDNGLAGQIYQRIEGGEARQQAAMHLYYRFREIDPASAERYRLEAGVQDDAGTVIVR